MTVVAAMLGLAVVGVVPAGAEPTDPEAPVTSASVDPTVPTSTMTPGTTVAPTTTSGANTSSTTSTTVPGTTLPPVDEATIESGGYASVPAPLIPSIEDDPLFHIARTVDDDLVKLEEAKVAYLKQVAATKKVAADTATVHAEYERVRAVDEAALHRLRTTKSILQAAALHAYAGFGSSTAGADDFDVAGATKPLSSRTYVRVTIADATRHVQDATAARAKTRDRLAAATETDDAGRSDLAEANAARKAAKKAVADAEKKLKQDRKALREQIASMPDMAPGMFDRLPDSAKLPKGAIGVESPVGTIVVPASADPRTAVALEFIVAQIGKPYIWGGTGPTGYDCSGLMLRGFQAAGVTSMPRVSQAQQPWADPVDVKDIQPGDLVFFGNPAYHVGVYIGGGLMINAPFTGARVRVDKVWSSVSGYGRARW